MTATTAEVAVDVCVGFKVVVESMECFYSVMGKKVRYREGVAN